MSSATAFGRREMAEGWTLNIEREDVCPIIRLPEGADLDGYLATLGKKERHEIRRKVRRAEAAGEVELVESTDPVADLDAFIDLHQRRWGELGLFPPTPGGDQARVFVRRLFELFGEATAADPSHPTIHLSFLTVGGRRIGASIHFETAGSILYYNAGIDPDARALSPGVVLLERLVRRAHRARQVPGRSPARRRAVQVRVGRGRRAGHAHPGAARARLMTAPTAPIVRMPPAGLSVDPCFEPVIAAARCPRSRSRIRVVELLATGTSGGAQEHVYNLVTRIDRERYEVSVLALSGGAGVRRLEKTGVSVCVLDEMSDDEAIEAVASHLHAVKADVVHNHMYRAEVIGTRAAWLLAAAGLPRPFVVGTVHSSRVRSPEDRDLVRRLTPRMDHLIAVSRAIVRKIEDEGRVGAPISLIYNGVDLARYAEQEVCCTLHKEYGIPAGAQVVGVVARLEPEKGHPTLLEAWPAVLEAVPNAHLLIVGEGTQREALEAQATALGLMRGWASIPATGSAAPPVTFTGRRDDVPAVTAALDVAVLPELPRGPGPVDPRGDGALAPGRRVSRRRHPRDDRSRPDRPPRPAARPRRPRRPRSSACSPTTRTPTPSAGPATTWSTSASAWS